MLIFRGAPALSDFRNQHLLTRLQDALPNIEAVYAEFMHFVLVDGELTDLDTDKLNKVLRYGPSEPVQNRSDQIGRAHV